MTWWPLRWPRSRYTAALEDRVEALERELVASRRYETELLNRIFLLVGVRPIDTARTTLPNAKPTLSPGPPPPPARGRPRVVVRRADDVADARKRERQELERIIAEIDRQERESLKAAITPDA